jgi:hypothetical protein
MAGRRCVSASDGPIALVQSIANWSNGGRFYCWLRVTPKSLVVALKRDCAHSALTLVGRRVPGSLHELNFAESRGPNFDAACEPWFEPWMVTCREPMFALSSRSGAIVAFRFVVL